MRLLRRKKPEPVKWLEYRASINVAIHITEKSILEKINMIDLTRKDLQIIRCIQPLIETHIEPLVTYFYDKILEVNELKHINQLIWLQNLILSIHMHYTYRKMKKSYSFHILI